MVERITTTAARLEQFPELGEVLPDYPERSYRQFVVGSYRLIYRIDPDNARILVVGVIHAARQLPPTLEGR